MILIFMLDLASVHASVWRWWDVRRLKPRRSARKRKDEFLKQFFSETLRCDFLVVAGVSFSSLRFWRFLEQLNSATRRTNRGASGSESSEELIKGYDSSRLRGLPSPEREVWIATHDDESLKGQILELKLGEYVGRVLSGGQLRRRNSRVTKIVNSSIASSLVES
jgi:hypothetical protein